MQAYFNRLVKLTNVLYFNDIFLCIVGKSIKIIFFYFFTEIFWPDLKIYW